MSFENAVGVRGGIEPIRRGVAVHRQRHDAVGAEATAAGAGIGLHGHGEHHQLQAGSTAPQVLVEDQRPPSTVFTRDLSLFGGESYVAVPLRLVIFLTCFS